MISWLIVKVVWRINEAAGAARKFTKGLGKSSERRLYKNLPPFPLHPLVGIWDRCGNDPSAGSPTDTLLRLHLPLNGKV